MRGGRSTDDKERNGVVRIVLSMYETVDGARPQKHGDEYETEGKITEYT